MLLKGAVNQCHSMEGHSGQKCNLIVTCIPLDRTQVPLDRTFLPLDRTSIPLDRTFIIGSHLSSTGSYLSSIPSHFNYFVTSYITLVYSSVTFHIYQPYFRGNSIPSDRNYRSAVVTIWLAVNRGRLNLDLVFVWRHTTYDYMTYN